MYSYFVAQETMYCTYDVTGLSQDPSLCYISLSDNFCWSLAYAV